MEALNRQYIYIWKWLQGNPPTTSVHLIYIYLSTVTIESLLYGDLIFHTMDSHY